MPDITKEIKFQTARSSGSGGQNVNKVETMAEGRFFIAGSQVLTGEQKDIISQKLASRINKEGCLLVKDQSSRSQLANKEEVIRKMNLLIEKALFRPKKRKATAPTKASRELRIRLKKEKALVKSGRKKIRPGDE